MNKKSIWVLLLTVTMALSLVACGGGSGSGGSGGDMPVLTIVNWADYGSDDPEFIAAFEEAYNCKVVHIYMMSEEDLLTRLRTSRPGEIDLALPNATILTAAIRDGLVKEIDVNRLENFDSLFSRFQTLPEIMMNGKHYAIPWVWGATAIGYNTDEITTPPTSMSILFDETYAGRITMRDDFNDAIMAAAIVTGQDPNNPTDMDLIRDTLLAQKPLNRTYWESGDEFSRLFAGGQIVVGMKWSGQAASMKQDGEPIGFVIPEDGAIGWIDKWVIAAGSENEELAYAFIDWMISKDFQYDFAAVGGVAPVNQKAAEAIDPEYAASAGMDEVSLNRLYFMEYRSDEVKREWNELWTEVKASR